MNIAPKQLKVLELICEGISANGSPPTQDELAAAMSVAKTTIFEHVSALIRNGLINKRQRHSARSLYPTPEAIDYLGKRNKCPHCGKKIYSIE